MYEVHTEHDFTQVPRSIEIGSPASLLQALTENRPGPCLTESVVASVLRTTGPGATRHICRSALAVTCRSGIMH
jgi:hypothetical protein